MAKRFTRNVKDVKDVKTFGINHTKTFLSSLIKSFCVV